MKIEMGESLFYSWLRHVKECYIVQTNWKVSTQWNLQHEEELQHMMKTADEHFSLKYGYRIFKKNSSLSQIILQGECDVVGISLLNGINQYYAVDVAFHSAGLNYGTREETVMKVIAKSIRTAMCLYGYMESKEAEIIFASPKINPSVMKDLKPCIEDLNELFKRLGYHFVVRVIANEEFNEAVLQPILIVSDGIADTNELFIRSYQMYAMFADTSTDMVSTQQPSRQSVIHKQKQSPDEYEEYGIYKELKVGKIVQVVLRKLLESGVATEEEVQLMQSVEYSKQHFDLQYPLLVSMDNNYDRVRYYAKPLIIRGVKYVMCSQWFETPANNDRPYLLKWIKDHEESTCNTD